MAKLAELRKQAKGLGISAAVLRRATTATELQAVIAEHSKPKAKAKAKAKGKVTSPVRKARKNAAPVKKSGRKASTPAKSKGAKAKRSSNSSQREPKGGRNLLGKVNFSKTDGWNPRSGSAPDVIIKALKKFKGDRAKVFTHLKPSIWDFVSKKKSNGDKRTKSEAEAMLRYRISRTAFDFAVRTGQHEPSDNRVEYGTGGTGNGTFKHAKAKKSAPKASSKPKAKKTTPKATRKPAARKVAPKKAARKTKTRR